MWYHSLNVGYRVKGSGETDFPCIFDERVGMARTYAKLDNGLDFDQIVDEIKAGRSYVSDGKSHIIDFKVNERELGTEGSELRLQGPQTVRIQARVAADDVETGQRLLVCEGSKAGIYTVAFHPNGQQLAAGGFDGRVRIYAS